MGANFSRDDMLTVVSHAIKQRRSGLGMTLASVNEESGVTVSQISDIEQGRTLPSIVTLNAVCRALKMTFSVGQTVFATYDIKKVGGGEAVEVYAKSEGE